MNLTRTSIPNRISIIAALAFVFCAGATPQGSFAAAAKKSAKTADLTEANIARLTGKILERSHYSQHLFDDEISAKFLNKYIEALDGFHLLFLESDLKEFDKYRTVLDDLTFKGDVTPAHIIFARFVTRMEERVSYVTNLLQTEKFQFKGDDRYALNRKDLPRPKNLAAAQQQWRQHMRYEYLQEKLSAPTNGSSTNSLAAKVSGTFTNQNRNATLTKPRKGDHEEIVKALTNRYTRLLRTIHELSDDEVLEIYLTALTHVYDPHSDYMGRAQMDNFAIAMKLSLFGIGALLESEDGYCQIRELVPGPAQRSKLLKPKDRIVAVAQADKEAVDVVGVKLSKVVEMIRGPKGTEVRLTVIPVDAPDPSARKVVSIIREEIKLEDQEAKARIMDWARPDGGTARLGVIDLPSFYEDFGFDGRRSGEHKSTTADVSKLLRKLKRENVEGVILDLRRNGGGALNEAINLTGLFIKKGPVVQVKDPDGRVIVDSDRDEGILYDGPLIVLTSRFSASASEILAGALQDYGRALIVGDSSTHGKGTVQSLLPLDALMRDNDLTFSYNPGALKVTIRKFYRASGSSTQLKGVVPDIILPSINNVAEVGEASIDNAMPWDEIRSADFEKMNRVQTYLDELRKRSTHRIDTDREFAYLREDIEQFKKLVADKSVSLNEQKRLKEKAETETRAQARKKERLARKTPEAKVYEITLRNADLPGLPEPVPHTNDVAVAETRLPSDSDLDSPAFDEKAPALDVTLDESRRILADFIALSEKQLARSVER